MAAFEVVAASAVVAVPEAVEAAALVTFLPFGRLPTELRIAIWEFALPEDAPEIYFIDWSHFNRDVLSATLDASLDFSDEWIDETFSDAKVTIGYPAMMHACHEARSVAKKKLAFQPARLRDGRRVKVPCRDFRPDLDVFYVNTVNTAMLEDAILHSKDGWYRDIRHVAIQAECLINGFDGLAPELMKFSALRELSIVYGRTWGAGPISFTEEAEIYGAKTSLDVRHYRLKEYQKKDGCLVHGSEYSRESVQSTILAIYDGLVHFEVDFETPWDRKNGRWAFTITPMALKRIGRYGAPRPRRLKRGPARRAGPLPYTPGTPSPPCQPGLAAQLRGLQGAANPFAYLHRQTPA